MTGAVLAMLSGAMITAGLLLGVYGMQRRPVRAPPAAAASGLAGVGGRDAALAALVAAGRHRGRRWWRRCSGVPLVVAVLLPLAVLGLPVLLVTSDGGRRIARLDAISEWTRNLASVITAGQSLEQALTASVRSTPDAVRPQVTNLVARLRSRWPTEAACWSSPTNSTTPPATWSSPP